MGADDTVDCSPVTETGMYDTLLSSAAEAEEAGRHVLVVLGDDGVREFNLTVGEAYEIGRQPGSKILVAHPTISRSHARLLCTPAGLVVEDLGGRNGTYVNRQRLEDGNPVLITPNDALRFGDVNAQVLRLEVTGVGPAKLVGTPAFDAYILDEADRCVRFARSVALVAVHVAAKTEATIDAALDVLRKNLRSVDLVTARGRRRIDFLTIETNKEQAIRIAERMRMLLSARRVKAKLGVASFPDDTSSPASLQLAAGHALREATEKQIGVAGDAVRSVRLGEMEIVVADAAMKRLFALVERVAGSAMPVLLTGETGSGKEIVSEALHQLSPRAALPLVKINCAAVPENLMESELFGYESGAFSGANEAKPGLFEQAEGGSLLLDEIGEMPASLQAKLLRVLEDHRVRRLGAVSDRKIDVRIVASTHRNLKDEVDAGRFRQDLFYRIGAMVLEVPPLRDRPREIRILAERFVAEASPATGPLAISEEAMQALERHDWPGNVRELRNVMGRTAVMCTTKTVGLADLPTEIAGGPTESTPPPESRTTASDSLQGALRRAERRLILEAIDACDGNQTQAAERLQIPRRTLVSKLAKHGIEGPRKRRN